MKGRRTITSSPGQWFVCSDLVSVRRRWMGFTGEIESAVLEEIGPDGAVVQLETSVAPNSLLFLDCRATQFEGVVRRCWKESGLGFFAEIAFTRGQHWSASEYSPRHLLNVALPKHTLSRQNHKHSHKTEPWEGRVALASAPPEVVCDTVRRVAQNLAVVCGEMNLAEMAQCFTRLFHRAPQGILFGGFVSAYRGARESLAGSYEVPVSPLRQVCRIAILLGDLPVGFGRAQPCV